jgi:hypothetical protein
MAKTKSYQGKRFHREAAQAGRRQIKMTPPSWMCYGMKVNAVGVDWDDEDQVAKIEDSMMNLPSKGASYIKSWARRQQLDHLPAIEGIVKKYVGRTFDEFYSFVRANLNANSVAGIHIMEHALEDIYFTFVGEYGQIYGNSAASRIKRWSDTCNLNERASRRSTNIYYVDDDGLIQIVVPYKINRESDITPSGFFRCPPGSTISHYYIGPFFNTKPDLNNWRFASGYGEGIVYARSTLPGDKTITGRYWDVDCDPYYLDITHVCEFVDIQHTSDGTNYTKHVTTKAKVVWLNDLFPS